MYEKQNATMKMIRSYLPNSEVEEKIYPLKVLECDPGKEYIQLVVTEKKVLKTISLDGLYLCTIENGDETVSCEIEVRERYMNKLGSIVCAHIKNGFMKKI